MDLVAAGYLITASGLPPVASWNIATTPPTPSFGVSLTTAQQATLADILTMMKFGISDDLTLAEFQAMKPDLATGKAYLGLTSPTNAQTVAAVKAIIRVLGDLLRS